MCVIDLPWLPIAGQMCANNLSWLPIVGQLCAIDMSSTCHCCPAIPPLHGYAEVVAPPDCLAERDVSHSSLGNEVDAPDVAPAVQRLGFKVLEFRVCVLGFRV